MTTDGTKLITFRAPRVKATWETLISLGNSEQEFLDGLNHYHGVHAAISSA